MHKFLEDLNKVIEQNANLYAYKWRSKFYTYSELKEAALVLSEMLKKEGTGPVILYGHKSVRMIISIVACLFAKRAYIPIDIYQPIERIKNIIDQTGAKLFINNSEAKLDFFNAITLEEFYEKYKSENLNEEENLNNIAYIIFTSGSTGEPKGVPISYDNLENFVEWMNSLIPNFINEKMRVLNQASFSFDLSVADFYYSLFNGHTLVPLENKDVENYNFIFEKIKDEKINMIVATSTFLKLLLLNKDFNEKEFCELKFVYQCGETLEVSTAKKLLEKFPNVKLINAYGPTEATSAVSGIVISPEMLEGKNLPVGDVSTAATEILIEDAEIILKGKSVFGGYVGKRVGGHFITETGCNAYKTGDLGEIKGGLLYCYGRKDSQIKYKGYRIELCDIERNIKQLPEIQDAVVVAKYKVGSNIVKNIKAYVILNSQIEIVEIKNKLNSLLPEYMIPSNIVVLEKFPINNNGKIDRKKLGEL